MFFYRKIEVDKVIFSNMPRERFLKFLNENVHIRCEIVFVIEKVFVNWNNNTLFECEQQNTRSD